MTKVKSNTHKSKSRKKSVITEATPKNQPNTTILEEEEEINSGFSSYLRSGEGILLYTNYLGYLKLKKKMCFLYVLRCSNDETFHNRQHASSFSYVCMATNSRDIFNC